MPIIDKLGIDKWLFPGIAARRARYMSYSRAQLTERTSHGEKSDRPDFFWHLLKATDPETGKGFSTPELWGESNLLWVPSPTFHGNCEVAGSMSLTCPCRIIAGSDTTSTAMAATLFYLTRHPAALERVIVEVRAKFAAVEDIKQGPALNELGYLRACIDEAMRLSPSVGGLLPREVLSGGTTIDGEFVPAGTVVGTPHYAIHHNEAYFPDAFSYIPERWIAGRQNPRTGQDVSSEQVEAAASAFCPFSIGPRGCIGKELAYVEMKTALARMFFTYDVRRAVGVLDPGEGRQGAELGREKKGEFQLVDTFTSVKNGPMVEFRRREETD
jgi:cytochrome P450